MDDDELLAIIMRNGGYPRAFRIWAQALLRKLEEILWQWHAERRYEHFTGPLFFAGGPPPFHFAVGDWSENNARSRQLTPRQRSLWGPGNTYIRALQRRLYMLAVDGRDGGADAVRAWRQMYRWWSIFADGREMQTQMRFTAFALAFSPGIGLRAGATPAAARGQVAAPRTSTAPPTPRTTPAPLAPPLAATPTLPGLGPDIGHAQTLPALPPVTRRRTAPGLGPGAGPPSGATSGNTLPGIGTGGTQSPIPPMPARRPGAGGGARTSEMRPMVEEAVAGATPGGQRIAGAGRLLPPGGSVERMTDRYSGELQHHFQNSPSGRELYAYEWRLYGGDAPLPDHGFIVRNADGTVHRAVGFGSLPGGHRPGAATPRERPGSRLVRPPGGSVEPLTEAERVVMFHDRRETQFNNYLPGPGGRQAYEAEWRFFGGQGPAPPHGFIVRQANYLRLCTVGFGPVPPRR